MCYQTLNLCVSFSFLRCQPGPAGEAPSDGRLLQPLHLDVQLRVSYQHACSSRELGAGQEQQ